MYLHLKKSQYFALVFFLVLSSTVFITTAFSATSGSYHQEQEFVLSDAELAQSLAPIALYPDTLLTHILIASTYPIEVIEAQRWLSKKLQENSQLSSEQLARKADKNNWEPSIEALLAFPTVMEKLSEDLTWMQEIGDAFLQNEARVLASIQGLRQQAEQAGSFDNIDNLKVVKEQKIIIIEPAQPEIIYVPYYDTRVVYGRWHWVHYPPIYWHNPHHYAASYGSSYRHFYWGSAVRIRTNFYFTAFHWKKKHVVVTPYHRPRHISRYSYRSGYHSNRKIVSSNQAKRWSHKATHRRGVAYKHKKVQQKYYGSRPSVHSTNTYKRSLSGNKNQHRARKSPNHKNTKHKVTSHKTTNQKGSRQKGNARKNSTYSDKGLKRKYVKNNQHKQVTHTKVGHKERKKSSAKSYSKPARNHIGKVDNSPKNKQANHHKKSHQQKRSKKSNNYKQSNQQQSRQQQANHKQKKMNRDNSTQINKYRDKTARVNRQNHNTKRTRER